MSLVSANGPSVTVFCLPLTSLSMFEGLAWVLDMTLVSKLLHPGHPFLHHLLHVIMGSAALGTAIKIDKLAHGNSSLVTSNLITFEARGNGHFSFAAKCGAVAFNCVRHGGRHS